MGADVHPYLELKIGKKWYFVGDIIHGRNYEAFSWLSGVRARLSSQVGGHFTVLYSMPKDVSKEIRTEWNRWGTDGHSLTIVDYQKLNALSLAASEKVQQIPSMPYDWLAVMRKFMLKGFAEDARVVLWYDN